MRNVLEPLTSAWSGVTTRKLRSFLTILGVVIGVASVIALMSIGRGTQDRILSSIQSLGSNLLFISPGATNQQGVRTTGSAISLTLEDSWAIAEEVPGIIAVAPQTSSSLQVVSGGKNTRTQFVGTTTDYPIAFNLTMSDGSFFTDDQFDSGTRVAVIGPNVCDTLFGTDDPIGRNVRVGNNIVQVVGVFQSKGQSMAGANDDSVIVPMTALRQMSGQSRTSRGEYIVGSVAVAMADTADRDTVMADIKAVLRERHRLAPGSDDDFTVTSVEELAQTMSEAMGSMTLLLGAIAAISLLVGGIGVMNIMLVSVMERTREIGIRKALGAREAGIWSQFLIEAGLLTLAGGIIGILAGWGVSGLVASYGNMPTSVSADIVMLAIGVSVGVGIFFGFYPAWHASRLSPIQALRNVE